MNDQAIRFRLGIFVLTAFILLAMMIFLFGGFPSYFKKADAYTLVFTNAQGVTPGTPVRRSGVRIGEVRSINLDNDTGKVTVVVQVDEGFTIRKSDRPTLVQGFLGSDTAIAFLPPEDPKMPVDITPVPPGSVMTGASETDMGAILQKTADLMPPAQEALVQIKNIAVKLDKMTPLLEETVREYRDLARTSNKAIPEFQKTTEAIHDLVRSVQNTVPDLKRTNEEFQVTARNWSRVGERLDILIQTNEDKIGKTVDRAEETLRRLSQVLSDDNQKTLRDILRNVSLGSQRFEVTLANIDELVKETRGTVKRVDTVLIRGDDVLSNMQKATKPFAERSDSILKNLDEGTGNLNRSLIDIRTAFQSFTRGEGTLQKLLNDPALYNNLNESAAALNRILPRTDHILRDVEIFADKIARHPESLGIGGAVHPGTGLKESPTILPFHAP